MNLSEIFIKRPIMTFLTMMTILFFGIVSYHALPISEMPNVEYPTIQVKTSYPGASSEVMANNVTAPLEKQFLTISGINQITSTSTKGNSAVVIQFNINKGIDTAAQDVLASINQATPLLPQDLPFNPTYTKINPAATPILYLAITSESLTLAELYDYANTVIGQRLNIVEGVAQVVTYGSPFAVRVQVDPQKLAAKGIGFDQLGNLIQSQNVSIPTGAFYGDSKEFNIDVDGQITKAEGYESLIIKNNEDGSYVKIQDVGRAIDSVSQDKFFMRYIDANTNSPSVILAIQKQPDANTMRIIAKINQLLPVLEKEVPKSLKIYTVFDKSVFIQEAVDDVQLTLLIAFFLVVIVVFVYLGKPMNALIPSLALPLSIIGTFAIMFVCNYTIDILSLLAITLSVGFLIDDAIVVLENIARHIEMGEDRYAAALNGSKEISFTILSMTLCLSVVFIPMIFMGGVLGLIFREFAVTIMVAVLISGFVSLSLTPMLCSRFISAVKHGEEKNKLELFSENLNQKMVDIYHKGLVKVIKHKKLALLGGFVSIGLTLFLAAALPKDFLPPDDLGLIQGFTQGNDSLSPFKTENYQKTLTKMIIDEPSVESLISIGAYPVDSQGILFVRLKDFHQRESIFPIISKLYAKMYQVPGMQVFLKSVPLLDLQTGTSASRGDYQYTLQSFDEEALYKFAPTMIQKIKQVPGVTQVASDMQINLPQVHLEILRDRASILNVTAGSIETALKLAFSGANLSPIKEPANVYYAILETLPSFYKDPSYLSQIYVTSKDGKLIPLDAVVKITEKVGPLSINHLNGLPAVTATFNLVDVPLGTALQNIEKIAGETLPPTVTGLVQGTANVFKSSFATLPFLILITVFLIYIILGILYENFFHPITVMSTLPPAALGGLLTLYLFGQTLSLYAFIGIIMLLGIVMKNGIILIDFANESIIKENKSVHDAIIHACLTRFRPILMTTIAAMMGALPIALGVGGMTAQSRISLGLVIVGGLIFSQVVTIFLTPVIYIYLETLKERFFNKEKLKAEGETL
ncbi:MAG: efflux RND transporter permease subunit [Chlamydiae bacterium]|nr:efflux RND transporter permease subunit [Chlamydiota bacterium]